MYIIFLWRTASLGTLEARTQKKWNAPHGNALHVFKTVAAGQGWKIRNREKKIKIHIVSLSMFSTSRLVRFRRRSVFEKNVNTPR